ncbi:peptidase S8 and S53 subtilisin kexin sedolisin [Candidatus Moduliflexus flocculans]|uniref:Peptidase S8 and S53 subtilisin kexin sedolisin n=1 Tax=Candidatus Moduliflexus flocculans TaxID=1499966 RepID=A0A081BSW3_9BACT|nr:peptidase S8 and S53 subtilisin kexin sedolisin [Candidatus Moduliflexus flocculans]
MAEIEASLLAKIETATVDGKPALFGLLHGRKARVETLIEATNGQTLKELKQAIKKNGGKKLKFYPEINTIYAEIPVDKVQDMAAASCVLHVYDANAEVKTMLYESVPFIMGAERIEIPFKIRGKKIEGNRVKIAVIDSGIDFFHPDFGWRIKARKNFSGVRGSKGNEHGTHVAGIIAGSGKVSGYRHAGVAPKALLYDIKVFGQDKYGRERGGTRKAVLDGIQWAIKQRVDVMNMSFGESNGCIGGTCPMCKIANYAVSKGITVVVAAGNSGPRPGSIACPGNAKDVMTVGACTKTAPVKVASFSSRGSSLQPNKPELVAPGVGIMAPQPHDEYGAMNGTSMAAPHVTGMAALLIQTFRHVKRFGKPTPAMIKETLIRGCVDLGENRMAQGSGVAHFQKTISAIQPPRRFFHLPLFKKKLAQTPAMATLNNAEREPMTTTCPAALNMFCPHYDERMCNNIYEQCIHFRRAQCQKLLQPQ